MIRKSTLMIEHKYRDKPYIRRIYNQNQQSQCICGFFFLPVPHTLPCNETLQTVRQEKSTCQELKSKDKEVWTDPRLLFMCHQIRLTTKENQQARLSFFVASLKSYRKPYGMMLWLNEAQSARKIFHGCLDGTRAKYLLEHKICSHILEFDVWFKRGQQSKSLAWGFYRQTRQ